MLFLLLLSQWSVTVYLSYGTCNNNFRTKFVTVTVYKVIHFIHFCCKAYREIFSDSNPNFIIYIFNFRVDLYFGKSREFNSIWYF